jgi:hypothetical protein
MRIKIIRQPRETCIDGIQLDRFVPGIEYDVGNTVGAYLMAMGWAEPLVSDPAATLSVPSDVRGDTGARREPSNLHREFYPPYYDGPQIVVERRRLRRRST